MNIDKKSSLQRKGMEIATILPIATGNYLKGCWKAAAIWLKAIG
jgi:hypothetical protein